MAKKGKKSKWKNLPSTFRTCIIGTIIFFVTGICFLIVGFVFPGIRSGDIHSVQAEIVSVNKVSRNLSSSQEEDMRKKGMSEDSIKYELKIEYRYYIDGKEYNYIGREQYDKINNLEAGGTESLKYALKDGKPIVNPETDTNYKIFGFLFLGLGLIAGLSAYVLRPKK